MNEVPIMNSERIEKVAGSMKWLGDCYQVSVPWKENAKQFTDSYKMAFNWFKSTEKKLLRSLELQDSYSGCITKYLEKGYIHKVPKGEKHPSQSGIFLIL